MRSAYIASTDEEPKLPYKITVRHETHPQTDIRRQRTKHSRYAYLISNGEDSFYLTWEELVNLASAIISEDCKLAIGKSTGIVDYRVKADYEVSY